MEKKIGMVCTPYKQLFELEKERARKRMREINIEKHGELSGYNAGYNQIIVPATINGIVCNALLDCGSDITTMNSAKMKASGGKDMLVIGASSRGNGKTINADINLGNEIIIKDYPVTFFDLDIYDTGKFDLIIGIDILAAGDFHLYQRDGLPYYEFRL